ncbi:MAG: diacylglycerol kinase family protein [Bacteroidia bacterium]|nr:hypothetical protein [Bacteroidia bacterium]MDW8333346.1 diacylglycerol kinase family protein [Bacteroidia bacterium]
MSLLIVANPISGKGIFEKVRPEIEDHLRKRNVEFEIWSWDEAQAIDEMMQKAVSRGFKKIAAAGGDGTVHHVGKRLIGTDVLFGVLPIGTGNGIANHFGLPRRIKSCLDLLVEPATVRVDTGLMNDEPFLGFAGIGGYDAYTAHRFAAEKRRTFSRYVKIALESYKAVPPRSFRLTIFPPEGQSYVATERLTALAALNTSQFGNGMTIARGERAGDGVFSLCTLSAPPAWYIPVFALKTFTRTLGDGDHYAKRRRVVRVLVEWSGGGIAQLDGEPAHVADEVEIRLRPQSLTFIVPPRVRDGV